MLGGGPGGAAGCPGRAHVLPAGDGDRPLSPDGGTEPRQPSPAAAAARQDRRSLRPRDCRQRSELSRRRGAGADRRYARNAEGAGPRSADRARRDREDHARAQPLSRLRADPGARESRAGTRFPRWRSIRPTCPAPASRSTRPAPIPTAPAPPMCWAMSARRRRARWATIRCCSCRDFASARAGWKKSTMRSSAAPPAPARSRSMRWAG